MPTEARKTAIATFPLRLMPSVRKTAEAVSEREGVSLNQFINLAVAEKLAHLQHQEWAANRKRPSAELAARALDLLNRTAHNPPEPGDALTKDYRTGSSGLRS